MNSARELWRFSLYHFFCRHIIMMLWTVVLPRFKVSVFSHGLNVPTTLFNAHLSTFIGGLWGGNKQVNSTTIPTDCHGSLALTFKFFRQKTIVGFIQRCWLTMSLCCFYNPKLNSKWARVGNCSIAKLLNSRFKKDNSRKKLEKSLPVVWWR